MTDAQTTPAKTWQDHAKALGGAALIVGAILLMLELLLALVDPWNMRYFNDLATLGNEIYTSNPERGYIMPDGTYELSTWTATLDDGGRVIPNTGEADCTIAILGDSVAFGYGVDDAAVWVNQLAQDYPDVQFVNYAVPRYNSTNVLMTYETYNTADAYLYLIINNDIDPAIDPDNQIFAGDGGNLPFLVRYTNFAIYRGGGTAYVAPTDPNRQVDDTPQTRRFFDEVDTLLQDERIYLAAFELETLTNTLLARDYDVTVLSYPPERISFTDYHLNPNGNADLAEQMKSLIDTMLAEQCSE